MKVSCVYFIEEETRLSISLDGVRLGKAGLGGGFLVLRGDFMV